MTGRLARGILALSLMMAGAAGAQSVTLDVESMRDLAFQAVQANRPGEALVIADALLARDPQDAAALILKAQALRAIGQLPAAEAAARAGFAAATTPELHYGAALVLAQILSLQEQRNFAQLWLRRASYYATTDEQRARVATDYGYVRKQNPLNLQFTLSLQPSNNVNNGAMRSIWDYYGIPLQLSGDAQALSGLVGSAGVSATYRLAQTQSSFDALTFDASQQLVFLSAAARDQAPNVTNSDYALEVQPGPQLVWVGRPVQHRARDF
jgi:hypothetical protein